MFEQRMSDEDIIHCITQCWQSHQIDIGKNSMNTEGRELPPNWLLQRVLYEASQEATMITFTPHLPYPERVVYEYGDGLWRSIETYHWKEYHPVNGILFTLDVTPGYRQYTALKKTDPIWGTLRAYLIRDHKLDLLDGFYVRDFDVEKQTFRYYSAKEVALRAESTGQGHRWHRRRFKAIRVFLEME